MSVFGREVFYENITYQDGINEEVTSVSCCFLRDFHWLVISILLAHSKN